MVQAVGIIIEYNPFHNGHKWHVETAKQQSGCPVVIGVMSGNFMQRGEPAIFDKWARAEMAVRGGVDLLLELPTAFALRSAQYFATGGIQLLQSLGIVSHICFGAEHADLTILKKIAMANENPDTIADMHRHLKMGSTYAAALGSALENSDPLISTIIKSPNNILGIEYLRAIQKYGPNLIPLAVTRQQSHYNDTLLTTPFASATAIRHALMNNMSITDEINATIPATTLNVIENLLQEKRGPVSFANFSNMILAQLRSAPLEKLAQLPTVSEGLHYKIRDCALQARNLAELLTLLKSKRYPYTRLQRIVLHSLLGTTQEQLAHFDETGPLYARVLAFNQQGRKLLKHINEHSSIPIITKTTHFLNSKERDNQNLTPLQKMLAFDTLATDLYTLGMPSSKWNMGAWDFRYPPKYIQENT